ncbi:hypothetical protein BH753_gp100 [Bacillus phage Shbh1]|uniref:Uncharacterized protein n=1 Tax=Bacillus phage Shbh1 TaxID=1796992 RepID=A0A142F1C5_9CAUD|nr:hypothetical protein BH753_gp100 [Bacillus phage Shbh1]AMQ66582.1 hypothetical protein [Bacillus phage Shbh1]
MPYGLNEDELTTYKQLVQLYTNEGILPSVTESIPFMIPTNKHGEPDEVFLASLLKDVELSVTLSVVYMSLEYADLQCSDKSEEDIVEYLRVKYENYLSTELLNRRVCFSWETVSDVIIEALLELPYMYVNSVENLEFDEDKFLEERLLAYDKYITLEFLDEEDFSEEDEEEDDYFE